MRANQESVAADTLNGPIGNGDELENLRIRSELMTQIARVIRERGLTQTHAAKILRVSQPRVSDLVRGKSDRFSIDALVTMLGYAGEEVSVVVRPRQKVA